MQSANNKAGGKQTMSSLINIVSISFVCTNPVLFVNLKISIPQAAGDEADDQEMNGLINLSLANKAKNQSSKGGLLNVVSIC